MTGVTRFPHYHHAENMITNHVMLMLRMLSPNLLEALLQRLCADEITVGPRFSQQISGAHSVPDGLILQEHFAVFVETKLGDALDPDQLHRHCQTIIERLPGRKANFLISLTSGKAGQQNIPDKVMQIALDHGITVVALTFGELVERLDELPVSDLSLQETLQEFSDFIFAHGLVPRDDQMMVAVPTGISWKDNFNYGVYYEPDYRNAKWQKAAFLGLYHDKCISHVGRIVAAVSAMQDDAGIIKFKEPEVGSLDDARRQAIRDVIKAAQIYYPGLESEPHRYYLVDKFYPTDFRKDTRGGMIGPQYFDIEKIGRNRLHLEASGLLAAQALDGRNF